MFNGKKLGSLIKENLSENITINAMPEQYANQTNWAADITKYTWRIPYENDNTISVSGSVTGSNLTYTIENAPENAVLIAARYNGSVLTDVRLVNNPSPMDTLVMDGNGDKFKLFLWENKTQLPLCSSWENK